MPTIPNASNIQEREFDTSKAVYRPDTSYAGVKTGAMAKLVEEQYERQTRSELAKAKVDFQLSQARQESMYLDDDDEETIEERYNTGSMDGLGKAAEGITDSNLRNAFVQESQVAMEQGRIKTKALVHQKRGDKKIAYLTNATDTIQKSVVDGYGDLKNAHGAIEGMWRSMSEEGYISNQDAEKQIKTSKYQMALGKLKTMDSDEQLEVLEAPWVVDQIPADMIARLKEEALADKLDDKALATAQGWMNEGLSIDDVNKKLDSFTDADEYDKTRNRFIQMTNDEELGNQQKQKDLYTTYFADVYFGEMKVNEIPKLEAYEMSDAQLNNLQAAEIRATKKAAGDYIPSFSDSETISQLRSMLANNQMQKLKTYFSENHSKLNEGDYRYYQRFTADGAADDPFNRGLRTANQTMTTLVNEFGLKNDKAAQATLWRNIEDRYNDYFDSNEKKPDGPTVNQWINDEFMEIKTGVGYFFDDHMYVKDMTPDQREDFFDKADRLRQRSPNITNDEIVSRYEKLLRAREESGKEQPSSTVSYGSLSDVGAE